jgi:hypothetical protein
MKYDSGDQSRKAQQLRSVQATASPMAPDDPTPSERAGFNHSMARVCALAALALIFAGIAYSRESGFIIYAVLLAIPYGVFVLARSSRKWQAWGWALAWVIIALDAIQITFTTHSLMRRAHRSDVVVLVCLITLLLALAAQLVFVRRAFRGRFSYGTQLFRASLYYVCLLILVGATLPNWYVMPAVRRENAAVKNLHKYSAAMDLYAASSQYPSYPPELSALAAPEAAGKIAPSSVLDSGLMCAQPSCVNNGYRFEYRPQRVDGRVVSYTISARPLEFEETGKYSFLLAAEGKIHQTREDRDALLTDGER